MDLDRKTMLKATAEKSFNKLPTHMRLTEINEMDFVLVSYLAHLWLQVADSARF